MSCTFWLIFVVGLLLRVAAIELRPATALSRAPDEGEYLALSRNLAHGHGFTLTGVRTAYRDVFFPFTASLVMRALGDSPAPVLYLQAALSLLQRNLALYPRQPPLLRARRPCHGRDLAPVPRRDSRSALFITETLFLFLWIAALVLFDRLESGGYRLTDAALVGIALGLLTLTRAAGVVLVGALALYLLLRRDADVAPQRWASLAMLLVATLITLLPWLARNARTVGAFTLNTNGGINLIIGSNPYAQGAYNFSDEVQALLPPDSAGEVARDRAGTRYALDYAREHPARTLLLGARKLAHLWSTRHELLAALRTRLRAVSPSAPTCARCPLARCSLTALPYMLIVLLGVAGLELGPRLSRAQSVCRATAARPRHHALKLRPRALPSALHACPGCRRGRVLAQPRAWQTATFMRRGALLLLSPFLRRRLAARSPHHRRPLISSFIPLPSSLIPSADAAVSSHPRTVPRFGPAAAHDRHRRTLRPACPACGSIGRRCFPCPRPCSCFCLAAAAFQRPSPSAWPPPDVSTRRRFFCPRSPAPKRCCYFCGCSRWFFTTVWKRAPSRCAWAVAARRRARSGDPRRARGGGAGGIVFTYVGLIRYEAPAAQRWRAVAAAFSVCVLFVLARAAAVAARASRKRHGRPFLRAGTSAPGTAFARLWETDAALWVQYLQPRSGTGAIPPSPSESLWPLVIMAFPYMAVVSLGVAGFYLVRHFPARGLFLLQIFYGILWLRAPATLRGPADICRICPRS